MSKLASFYVRRSLHACYNDRPNRSSERTIRALMNYVVYLPEVQFDAYPVGGYTVLLQTTCMHGKPSIEYMHMSLSTNKDRWRPNSLLRSLH
jgi:hypothetical protein